MLYSPASLLVEPNEVLVLIGAYCRPFASLLSNASCALCPVSPALKPASTFWASRPTCFLNNRRHWWERGGSEGRRHQIHSLFLSARWSLFCVLQWLQLPLVSSSLRVPSSHQLNCLDAKPDILGWIISLISLKSCFIRAFVDLGCSIPVYMCGELQSTWRPR